MSSFRAHNRARRIRAHEHMYRHSCTHSRSKRDGLKEHLLAQWGIKEWEKNASELQTRIMHPHDETCASVETTRCLCGWEMRKCWWSYRSRINNSDFLTQSCRFTHNICKMESFVSALRKRSCVCHTDLWELQVYTHTPQLHPFIHPNPSFLFYFFLFYLCCPALFFPIFTQLLSAISTVPLCGHRWSSSIHHLSSPNKDMAHWTGSITC